jgi:transposase
MNVHEILRLKRRGISHRKIAEAMKINRKTVDKYASWLEAQGYLVGEMPEMEELEQQLVKEGQQQALPQNVSSVEPFREVVVKLRERGVEMAAIHQRLSDDYGYQGSYASVWRFVRQLEPKRVAATVRIEVRAGEEGQVDFGSAGKLIDPQSGKARQAWAFVMTLSFSRHQYVEFVFDQKVETWLKLHQNAFEFFSGVPERVVVDNLKAAISRACWENPQVQRAYRECALHYGFLIAPCRPGKPEHKGKVEQGGVHYVKRNFVAGRDPEPVQEANRAVRTWCNTTAGLRTHGTIRKKPLEQFERIEREQLQPLAAAAYEPGTWKRVKLHRDCYVVFERSYYSAPHRLIGDQLWVRGGLKDVRIYTENHEFLAIHSRAKAPGERHTHLDHLPAEKVPGMLLNRPWCQKQAAEIGPTTSRVVQALLDHRPEDRLRSAGRLLRLADTFGAKRLEAACTRATAFGESTFTSVHRILQQGLDRTPLPERNASPPASRFVRSAQDFARQLLGARSWN